MTKSQCSSARSRARRGISTLETALALPILLLLLFGIFDFGRLLFTHMALQHAVTEGARYAVTGQHMSSGGSPLSRVDSIIHTVVEEAEPFVELPPGNVSVASAGGGAGSAGGPGDIVTVTISYRMELLTPLIGAVISPNGYVFTVSSVFKNEPFPSAFSN